MVVFLVSLSSVSVLLIFEINCSLKVALNMWVILTLPLRGIYFLFSPVVRSNTGAFFRILFSLFSFGISFGVVVLNYSFFCFRFSHSMKSSPSLGLNVFPWCWANFLLFFTSSPTSVRIFDLRNLPNGSFILFVQYLFTVSYLWYWYLLTHLRSVF